MLINHEKKLKYSDYSSNMSVLNSLKKSLPYADQRIGSNQYRCPVRNALINKVSKLSSFNFELLPNFQFAKKIDSKYHTQLHDFRFDHYQ